VKKLENFEDVEKVLRNYKDRIQQCLNIAGDAQSKCISANMRSNDNTRDINSIVLSLESKLGEIDSIKNDLDFMGIQIEYLKLPWYKKMLCKIKKLK
jgi:CRISPR/Cas system CSM-associated protein Csm2 small subunit